MADTPLLRDSGGDGEATRLWIVSPMLHDTESFLRLRGETVSACVQTRVADRIRFLVVDDSAGTDSEVARLHDLDDVEVLTPPFNLGHQRAIVFGLRFLVPRLAGDELVVTMDSDGEDQPADVPRLIAGLQASTAPLVLAERTKRKEQLRFRVMYLFFRVLFRVLTGTRVKSGNFALQRARSLAASIDHPSFDLCYSSTLLALRRPTTMVPCARGERFAGRSRMSSYALVAHGVRMLLPFSERIAVRMMIVAAASFAALAGYLVMLATGVFGDAPGWPAIAPLIGVLAVFLASFSAFVVLFSGFAQGSAIATKGIGVQDRARDARTPTSV
jgi:hypothetical protein